MMRRIGLSRSLQLSRTAATWMPTATTGSATCVHRWCATTAKPPVVDDDDADDFVLPQAFTEQASTPSLGAVQEDFAPEHVSRLRVPLETTEEEEAERLKRADSRNAHLDDPSRVSKEEAMELAHYVADMNKREGSSSLDASNVAQPLPFDDEQFAETLLKMEVDGVIDETWQDNRKARIEDAKEIVDVLRQMRVSDVVVVDTSAKTASFDYMVFGTCEGARHMNLAAWAVQEADKFTRVSKVKRKKADAKWEPICVGRIVVNLMTAAYRESVNFERKWVVTKNQDALNAARAPVSEGRQVRVHGLWTLTLNLQDLEDFEVDYCKEYLLDQR